MRINEARKVTVHVCVLSKPAMPAARPAARLDMVSATPRMTASRMHSAVKPSDAESGTRTAVGSSPSSPSLTSSSASSPRAKAATGPASAPTDPDCARALCQSLVNHPSTSALRRVAERFPRPSALMARMGGGGRGRMGGMGVATCTSAAAHRGASSSAGARTVISTPPTSAAGAASRPRRAMNEVDRCTPGRASPASYDGASPKQLPPKAASSPSIEELNEP
mmetsp:Transcript_721/g.2338  ORF Transcript_721/g.2338 Transcript_721/m.2338 type:complete len:223 (+) Transcript_721:382-1050(+)